MKHDARCLALVAAFIVASICLGARPYLRPWKSSLNGSNVGAYNMFVARVEFRELIWLASGDGTYETKIGHAHYFWMNRFISHTHSRVEPGVVKAFAKFLAARMAKLPDDDQDLPADKKWFIVVRLAYRKNGGDWHTILVKEPL